jgi:Right handed beta helix region/Periplasmic copper-binding protein (NosD)
VSFESRRIVRSLRLVTVVVFVATASLFQATSAFAATRVVDDDRRQCSDAQFASINLAIAAASPGDTVKVCAGLYRESVRVAKTVSLSGPGGELSVSRCLTEAKGDPLREAVVDPPDVPNFTIGFGNPPSGFRLEADGIRLAGFTIQGALDGAGVSTSPLHSGYDIRKNVIQNNTFGVGVDFHSAGGALSLVDNNCIRENSIGVYSSGDLRDARVGDTTFTRNGGSGIAIERAVSIKIDDNHVIDDGGIAIEGTTNAVIKENEVLRGGGIQIGSDLNARVEYNDVIDSSGTGISVFGEMFRSSHGRVVGNDIVRSGYHGVWVFESRGWEVAHNDVEDSGWDGIWLGNSAEIEVAYNDVFRSAGDGLHVGDHEELPEGTMAHNVIEYNETGGSGGYDCFDESIGSGTAGTENVWLGNSGLTENRPDLCR